MKSIKALLDVLSELPKETLCDAFVELNNWKWPSCIESFKPEGWDSMDAGVKVKHPAGLIVWQKIHVRTTAKSRSEAWWLQQLGETKEEHEKWWKENYTFPRNKAQQGRKDER